MSWRATAFAKETRGHTNMSTKAVLYTLADYHNEAMGFAWCSQATLADDCECSISTVRNALKKLEQMGFITQTKKGNQYQPSNWVFNFVDAQAREPLTSAQLKAQSEPVKSTVAPKSAKVNRQSGPSEPLTPTNTNPQEPPQVSFVKTTMDTLEGLRGYPPGNYGAEAKAVKDMGKLGYTTAEIMACYEDKKKDAWWKEKPLTMMSVKSAIGEWKKHQTGPAEPEGAKYTRDAERLANRPVARGQG